MEETLLEADAAVAIALNHWVVASEVLRTVVRFIASDYLVPVVLSLTVLGMWVGPRTFASRERYQRAAIVAVAGMGFAALAVHITNDLVFRPRPFMEHPLTLLFYFPTDSSFPLHAAAVGFGFATGIWLADKRLGVFAVLAAAAWSLARVMAGVAYPSDALAGAVIGVVVTLMFYGVLLPLDPLVRYLLGWARRLYLA